MSDDAKSGEGAADPPPVGTFIGWVWPWWRLEQAQTAEDFYKALAELIRMADRLDQRQREVLGALAEKPFKRRPGRPRKSEKRLQLDWLFDAFNYTDHPWHGYSRAQMIRAMGEAWGLDTKSGGTAGQRYDEAKRRWGEASPHKAEKK